MKAYVSYAGKGKSVVRTAKVNKSSSAVLETIQLGTLINTAEYNIDSRLEQWGYRHNGEYESNPYYWCKTAY